MKSTDRIGDVISSAGGVTEYADLTEINLAMILEDQMILLIPRQQTDLVKTSVTDVFVDIKGEVMYPGLYSVPSTYRIFDLISRAGGLTPYADTSLINLSSWVEDQMVIVIPSYLKVEETNDSISKSVVTIEIKGEVVNPGLYSVDSSLLVRDVINLAGGVTEYADLSDLNLSQNIVKNMSIVIQKKVTSSVINNDTGDSIETSDDERTLVNINTAMLDELDTLPGIGYIIAQRIIDYRAEYGPFESIEDIMNVSGIKESVYDQIKELICI
jgi:competence protein ComEA